MAKKIIPLKHIYPKDIHCMSILARSGAIDRDTFHKLQISDNRISTYERAGLIHPVYLLDKHGTSGKTYYEITEKQGKTFCRNECNIKHFISNGNSSTHNAKVSECISNLSKAEQSTCLSERELKPFIESRLQEYQDRNDERYEQLLDALKNNQLSMPDVVYKTELNTYEAIEVYTDNYGKIEIDSKTLTCKLLNIGLTFIHT